MEIRTNEPMARHTSFRVGGPADRFVIPESETELREAVLDCKKSGQPWYMIGNGSNLLVGDKGFRGTIISTERLAELEVQKNDECGRLRIRDEERTPVGRCDGPGRKCEADEKRGAGVGI